MTQPRIIRRTRRFSRAPKPMTSWGRFHDATTTIAASTAVLLDNFGGQAINNTLLRSRGRFTVATNAINANIQGAFGMCVVSDAAITAGVASIPTPITESLDDIWFVWEGFQFQAPASLDTALSVEFEFDSRAQRRLVEGTAVALVVENATANSFDFAFSASLLTRLSH